MAQSATATAKITRFFETTPEVLFDYWTNPEKFSRFMCAGSTWVETFEGEVKVGGQFQLIMADATMGISHRGEYVELQHPHKISFTWMSPATHEQPSLVTITFDPVHGGTNLTLIHEQLPSDHAAGQHQRGWTSIIDKLAQRTALDSDRSAFRLKLEFPAPDEKIYSLLTSAEGIHQWWTECCTMDPLVGGLAQFSFPRSGFSALARIKRLETNRLVVWDMLDCTHPAQSGFIDLHDWRGTEVAFELMPTNTGSTLSFAHRGLTLLECKDVCMSGWQFFLGTSLRALLCDGVGQPYKEVLAA